MTPFTDGVVIGSAGKLRLDDRARLLRQLPLFTDCSRRHLKALARLTRSVQLDAGESLVVEGSPSTEAYVIVAGRAEVRKGSRKVATLGPGDVVGELGLLLDRPRNAAAIAVTELECLAISQRDLRACVEESPELGWLLLHTVAQRLGA